MHDPKQHLRPHFAVENEMVGIKVDALAQGQLIDAMTAFEIAAELEKLGNKLMVTLEGVKLSVRDMELDDKEEDKAFILTALKKRLGLDEEG